jgi:hypothetical protein
VYFRDMVRGVIPNQETHERGPTLFSNFAVRPARDVFHPDYRLSFL